MSLFSRTDQSIFAQWWWTVDRFLLTLIFILISIGVVMVAASSPPVATRIGLEPYHFIIRHLIVLGPAIVMMLAISLLEPKQLWKIGLILLGLCFVGLIYVLGFGMEIKGAQRWIHLPGFSLQPSELAKPAFIIVAAKFMAQQKEREGFPGMPIAIGLYAVLALLLILQPDMGMTVVLTFCFLVMVFLAGLPFRYVFVIMGGGALAAILAYFTLSHVKSRVDRFLYPETGDTFQVDKSLEAFRSGGFFGTGFGQGEVKLSIPDAHADFVFSVAGEEFGVIALILLVGLYGYIILHSIRRVSESEDLGCILATSGLMAMIGLQALIHMGSSLHLLPAKGMTLPFLSYGGSSLLSISLTMGMVLSLTRRQGRSTIARHGVSARSLGRSVA